LLEQHAVSTTADTNEWVFDETMPTGLIMTPTSFQGAGEDGPLSKLSADELAALHPVEDSPTALAFADLGSPSNPSQLFVLVPFVGGSIQYRRIFYGPPNHVQERHLIPTPESPLPPHATNTVTFDLDGVATTLPTVVTRDNVGLLDGSGITSTFYCF
jgi:hypothetical protein